MYETQHQGLRCRVLPNRTPINISPALDRRFAGHDIAKARDTLIHLGESPDFEQIRQCRKSWRISLFSDAWSREPWPTVPITTSVRHSCTELTIRDARQLIEDAHKVARSVPHSPLIQQALRNLRRQYTPSHGFQIC